MTDRPILDSIPFRLLRRAVDRVKKLFYTKGWPSHTTPVIADADPETVERYLRGRRCAEGVPLSYNYEGQDLDLRIPWGFDEQGRALEFHLRGRAVEPDGPTELLAHVELSRYEHTDAHIAEEGLSWDDGMDALANVLEAAPFDVYE